ncbi:DUF4331 family protein [Flavobacterium sp.]|jgi:hypothetical protein|uniref:DUF4331 family protein n=1 Tax=Flavobacterium sp. TaxID=239 RepID=UPI00374DE853
MKTNKFKIIALSFVGIAMFTSCNNDDNCDIPVASEPVATDFSGTYVQKDQMARPAINTVFIASGAPKDAFNTTTPSSMGATYQSVFQSRLLALNPGYTTNLLGLNAAAFTGVLATDVLNVAKTGPTSFYNGTQVLTGRALADDVIDVELILIFGGPTNSQNPTLTSDHVDANDKPFLSSFPYLATSW